MEKWHKLMGMQFCWKVVPQDLTDLIYMGSTPLNQDIPQEFGCLWTKCQHRVDTQCSILLMKEVHDLMWLVSSLPAYKILFCAILYKMIRTVMPRLRMAVQCKVMKVIINICAE